MCSEVLFFKAIVPSRSYHRCSYDTILTASCFPVDIAATAFIADINIVSIIVIKILFIALVSIINVDLLSII